MSGITGIDYSFDHPTPAQIKTSGARFVCRYLAPVNSSTRAKVITRDEAQALRAADLGVVLVWEWTADRAAAGRAAGVADARAALAQADALGADGCPIFFAVDFDASTAQCSPDGSVYAYAQGWSSVLGFARSGVYGGYTAVSKLVGAGMCRYGWQTIGWSDGRWSAHAQIRQTGAGSIDGHSIDWNTAESDDYGVWEPDDMTPAQAAQLTAIQQAVTGHGIASAGYRLVKNGKSAEAGGAADVHQVWNDTAEGVASILAQVSALSKTVASLSTTVAQLSSEVATLSTKLAA